MNKLLIIILLYAVGGNAVAQSRPAPSPLHALYIQFLPSDTIRWHSVNEIVIYRPVPEDCVGFQTSRTHHFLLLDSAVVPISSLKDTILVSSSWAANFPMSFDMRLREREERNLVLQASNGQLGAVFNSIYIVCTDSAANKAVIYKVNHYTHQF